MKRKAMLVIAVLIVISLLCVYFVYFYYLNDEDEPISVKEFNNNRNEFGQYYKDYKEGDVVHIKDKVYDVEVFTVPEFETNTYDIEKLRFSNFTENYLTFTKVTFSNVESLNFTGDRSTDFKVGETVSFTLPIEKYEYVPNVTTKYHPYMALAEPHYNMFVLWFHEYIYWSATAPDNHISFQIENITNGGCIITISSFIDNTLRATSKETTMSLWMNGNEIDELITSRESKNGYFTFIRTENPDYWTGSNVIINHSKSGNQRYEFVIRSKYTYPKPGFEDGRIMGNISWEM